MRRASCSPSGDSLAAAHDFLARAVTVDGSKCEPRALRNTSPWRLPLATLVSGEWCAAALSLDSLRRGWLNPPQVTDEELRGLTLNLYNNQPTWLRQAHERLDRAVHAAYEWPYPLSDEDVLSRLGRAQQRLINVRVPVTVGYGQGLPGWRPSTQGCGLVPSLGG